MTVSIDATRWVTPPPAIISEEIASALRRAVKTLCDGIGIASPLGREVEEMELSSGYLNVVMTRGGRLLAHWEPDEYDADEDEVVLH